MQSKNIKSMSRAGFMTILAAFFICLGLIGQKIYAAQQSKPLLIPGKRTLYQKVITHPSTKLYALAGSLRKYWKNGSSCLRYTMFTSVPQSVVSRGLKSGFEHRRGCWLGQRIEHF